MRLPLGLELDMDRKVGQPHCAQGQQSNIACVCTHAQRQRRARFPLSPLLFFSLRRFERRGGWGVGIKLSMTACPVFALWILPGEVVYRRVKALV
jgi:hypothetical protein